MSKLHYIRVAQNLLKLLRDKGISKNKIDSEELNSVIRYLYSENLNEFTFEQYNNMLIYSSYIIFTKIRPSMTLSECYGNLLQKLDLAKETENTIKKRNNMQPVIDLLLEKKRNKEPFNLPEGFKFVKKTNVKYNSRLAPHFLEILGEGNFICYQILEDILFHISN